MDIFSILVFFIYIAIILMILLYVSPIVSAIVLILIPLISVILMPELAIRFFSLEQFSFIGVSIQNAHILLSIWSALIGIVAYTEIVSWYLLLEEKPMPEKPKPEPSKLKPEQKEPEKPAAVPVQLVPGETQKPIKNNVKELLLKLGKIMSGSKKTGKTP